VPSEILGQLGNRVQHALRAFTPEDAKALKATVSTFPKSQFYDMETLLTGMGIGEAAVTILSESGVPTPVVQTRIAPPAAAAPAQPAGDEAQPQARPAAAAHKRAPAPAAEHKEAAGAMAGGVAAVTAFLGSREGKQIQKEVVRGVFGLLKKRL
jgi:uncharacterized protein